MLTCQQCQSDDIDLVERLPDGRREVACLTCGATWIHGTATIAPKPRIDTFAETKRRFPRPDQVAPQRMALVERLKKDFLQQHPAEDPAVAPYWRRYQQIFSRHGLHDCDPQDLKDFANTTTGAHPGNMSVFNAAWKEMGTEAAAQRTRDTIEYLLYGPAEIRMEDRLTDLINGQRDKGMRGFRESLLTKVLCIMQPDRFLPILIYSSPAGGKREIAKLVYGLDLPDAERVTWKIGLLILWSNDVLLELAGDGFRNTAHLSEFLWRVKNLTPEAPLDGSTES